MAAGPAPEGGMWTWEAGWEKIIYPKAIEPLKAMLSEGLENRKVTALFGPKDYIATYSTAYTMCTQRNPHNFSEQLYDKHKETITTYLQQTVLPALREKHDVFLLQELCSRWESHKIMNEWLRKFFMYLDRYHAKHQNLSTLQDSGLAIFNNISSLICGLP